jgi:hypothetical protein
MTEGTVHKDEKMVRRGYHIMKDAVAAWPEFNPFTAGYTASTQPVHRNAPPGAPALTIRSALACMACHQE